MSDPIAQAAAQIDAAPSSTEPGVFGEIIGEFKAPGEKVEHLIHPEGGAAAPGELATAGAVPSESAVAPIAAELPNAGTGSPGSGEPKVGLHDPAAAIRAHIANIKQHLSIRGFEQSLVQDIHAELDKIEGWL